MAGLKGIVVEVLWLLLGESFYTWSCCGWPVLSMGCFDSLRWSPVSS